MKANIVFKNGVVYTADKARTIAEAVAVVDGKIAYVGNNAGVEAYVGPETEVVDLGGKMLMPSFFEGHAHYTSATSTVVGIDLAGMDKEEEYVAAMKKFIAEHPDAIVTLGEFGTIRSCPVKWRENWCRDVISFCDENEIPFTIWNYLSTPYDGNRFSLVDDDYRKPVSGEIFRMIRIK